MTLCLLKDTELKKYFLMQFRLSEEFIERYEKPYNIIDITDRLKIIR